MHCHLLWGVDDGAHILRDSLEIISRLKEKGFRGAYCTPHISSRYPSNTPARLKARFQQLLVHCRSGFRACAWRRITAGTTILNRRLRRKSRSATTAATCSWSFPSSAFPAPGRDRLQLVQEKGFVPVLAHPERYGKDHASGGTGCPGLTGNQLPGEHRLPVRALREILARRPPGNSRRKTCTCGGEQTPTMPTCSPNSACNTFPAGKGGTPAFSLHPPP